MTNEQILEQQVEALEKLLQLRSAIIEELEAKVAKLQAQTIYPGMSTPYTVQPYPYYATPYVGSIIPGTVTVGGGSQQVIQTAGLQSTTGYTTPITTTLTADGISQTIATVTNLPTAANE